MSDLDLIKQLEKEIGIELQERDSKNIMEYEQRGFAIDKNGNVIGLNLNEIKLDPVPPSLSKLRHLKKLSLSSTNLQDISFLQELSNLTYVDLSDNQITDYSFLQGLSNLTSLDLVGNQITDISFLQGLSNLTYVDLSGNQITDYSFLQGLSNLTSLDLAGNQITDISPLTGLTNLKHINLWHNKIVELPEEILNLELDIDVDSDDIAIGRNGIFLLDNPIEKPPLEIVRKGREAIKAYFESLKKEKTLPLNEVKVLLVGDGGAGKTSLVKGLLGQEFDINESQTHGINIDTWAVKEAEKEIKVNIWDFGGQEIMHATHQFFLSKRSLYILVLDGRKDEKTEYWLKHIESFGGDSPVLVVINKIDENPGFEVNRKFLQEKYKNIKGFYRVSCKSKKGINTFESALKEELSRIEMLKTTWAASWFNVKTSLENMEEHFISYKEYLDICTNENINTKSSQDTLVDFLNDLGIAIHFKELELEDTHVLEPKWVTEAVYKIINSEKLAKCNGVLKVGLLDEILKQKDKDDYYYPPDKYRYIIELMKKFELCYKLDANQVLIPDLLEVEERTFDFNYDSSLKFIIEYDFLPKSVMPRFIVRMNKDIKEGLQWRTGVVLEDKAFHSTAVVKSDERDRKIYIFVNGEQKRDYFSTIRKTLRDINGSFEKLETKELVPLPDNPEITVEYDELIGHESGGKSEIYIGKLRKGYSVSQLLDGIEKPDERKLIDLYQAPPKPFHPDTQTPELKKKSKWYNILWKVIVGLGIIAALAASIIAIIKELSK